MPKFTLAGFGSEVQQSGTEADVKMLSPWERTTVEFFNNNPGTIKDIIGSEAFKHLLDDVSNQSYLENWRKAIPDLVDRKFLVDNNGSYSVPQNVKDQLSKK